MSSESQPNPKSDSEADPQESADSQRSTIKILAKIAQGAFGGYRIIRPKNQPEDSTTKPPEK